jgi:hypothetical protein
MYVRQSVQISLTPISRRLAHRGHVLSVSIPTLQIHLCCEPGFSGGLYMSQSPYLQAISTVHFYMSDVRLDTGLIYPPQVCYTTMQRHIHHALTVLFPITKGMVVPDRFDVIISRPGPSGSFVLYGKYCGSSTYILLSRPTAHEDGINKMLHPNLTG